jgi:hypothetical protein
MLWFTFKVAFGTIPAGWVAGWLAGKELIIRLSSVQLELELGLELGYKVVFHVKKNRGSLLFSKKCGCLLFSLY